MSLDDKSVIFRHIKPPPQKTADPNEAGAVPVPGSGFRYLLFVGLVVLLSGVGLTIAAVLTPEGKLSSEDGFMEIASSGFWLVAFFVTVATFFRWPDRADRLSAIWWGAVILLAFLRELDAHVYLNPEHFGRFGVRYRVDWWLNGEVSIVLKLAWATLATGLLALLLYIPLTVRTPLIRMARRGQPMAGLFFCAILFLGLGFVLDDILRGMRFIPRDAKKIVEESSEMLGAFFFLASAWLRWKFPLAVHRKTASNAGQE